MKRTFLVTLVLCLSWFIPAHAAFQEPTMADYTAYPIFTNQSVPPNIMVILDNSGSMNFNAYGSFPAYVSGQPGTVTDTPYEGEPYSSIRTYPLLSAADDLEEYSNTGAAPFHNGDLDFGGYNGNGTNARLAVRFQNLDIPQGATITAAYIQFTAITTTDAATYPTDQLIEGQASDNAPALATTTDYIKNMTPTAQTVAWNAIPSWTAGTSYQTADIAAILQEIVNRPGWASGNAAAFRFSGSGYREAYAFEGSSTRAPVLRVTFKNPVPKRYYGYFSPDHFYTYASKFDLAYKKVSYDTANSRWNVEDLSGSASTLTDSAIVTQKLWDGNFLNWLSMRRIDVLRKVLMGGKATARTGGGNQVNYGEIPQQTGRDFKKAFDTTGVGPAVSPYDGNFTYTVSGGEVVVSSTRYSIRVQKDITHEPDDFMDGNLAGVLQRVGNKARWGNIWFNDGTGSNESGGTVEHTIGTNMTTLITDLQNTGCDTWTPLAESFYVAMQYFKQEDPASGLSYPNSAVPNSNLGDDPYYNSSAAEKVWCAKSFVILLTDGASTKDAMIPSTYKDFDGDGKDNTSCNESTNSNCNYADGGTDFLDDLALYARTKDLRADLENDQNIILYAIYAFGNDPNARALLMDAARNGGFDDRDGDGLPDGAYTDPPDARLEWDLDRNGDPDTYFEANDGYALQAKLLQAISDILRRASSGTAASVLATNAEGAGNSVQAYFRPAVGSESGLEEARWLGYLQSLWVDPWGNLREDTNGNHVLDLKNSSSTNAAGDVDRIITFFTGSTDTLVNRYHTHYMYNPDNGDSDTCMLSDCSIAADQINMELTAPLFEAGKLLADRDPGDRKIFTYLDKDLDSAVDDSGTVFDTSEEVISFEAAAAAALKPYLGVRNSTVWAKLGSTHDARVSNIINYIRGTDITGLRNRTLDGITWRLGDIVHSTPLVVGSPAELFHQLYRDDQYADFLAYASKRETVIYVGANDGMLHAFSNWKYTTDPDGNPSYVRPSGAAPTERLGDEIWAYIPGSVLPHLKWTALPEYTHTYYVDSEVRVFDANVLPDDTYYSDGDSDPNYGTFLIMGLNMGGKQIQVEEDFGTGTPEVRTFNPTYTLLDITDPRNPKVIWERAYSNLGMSSSIPAPVRVGDRWFLVFGSGPTEYDGNSSHGSYIYVVDLLTGNPYGSAAGSDSMWGPLRANASFNDPLALDLFQSANVDAIYMANNYYASNSWQSEIYKIAIPCSTCSWDGHADEDLVYNVNPSQWVLSRFFESDRPVTVKLNSTIDPLYNVLLYFGTGRYISDTDKTSTDQNYLYGVKDPFYNGEKYDGSYYHNFSQTLTLDRTDLFAADNVKVTTEGHVLNSPYGAYFTDFVTGMRLNADGWYVSLLTNGTEPSERVITLSSILGGIVLTPTYIPNAELCAMGGDTALVGVYYETGTGYKHQLFDIENKSYASITIDGTTTSEEIVAIRDDNLLKGTPAPKIIFHAGMEGGARAIIQQGSGVIENIGVSPALYFKSIVTEWWDNENTP